MARNSLPGWIVSDSAAVHLSPRGGSVASSTPTKSTARAPRRQHHQASLNITKDHAAAPSHCAGWDVFSWNSKFVDSEFENNPHVWSDQIVIMITSKLKHWYPVLCNTTLRLQHSHINKSMRKLMYWSWFRLVWMISLYPSHEDLLWLLVHDTLISA